MPIDHYSYEAIELLKDMSAQWQTVRRVRESAAMTANKDPAVATAMRVPDAEIYAIDVSFAALKDQAEREYLNKQPTSFSCRRGGRSAARRGGNDHHGVARIPAAAEGCGREAGRGTAARGRRVDRSLGSRRGKDP